MDDAGTSNSVTKPAIDLLLEASQDSEGDYVMDDVTLRDNLLTLFSAGTETTATTMSWVLSFLGCYPEVGRGYGLCIDISTHDVC
jgi:cytochrome P450